MAGAALMGSSLALFLLLLSSSHATGPGLTLQVKIKETFQGKDPHSPDFQEVLLQLCLLLPSGTNITLHLKGSPHRLTC